MSARALGRVIAVYLAFLLAAFGAVRAYASLTPITPVEIRSRWERGVLVARGEGPVVETAIAESPLFAHPLFFGIALVPGRDGVHAQLDGKDAWVTVDDLLAAQAYDRGTTFIDASMGIGVDRAYVLHLLAERLGTTAKDVEARATLRRARFERKVDARIDGTTLTRDHVVTGVREAARFLARSVDDDGRYRYLVLATSNRTLDGYNWPRHAGATYFLAQAAAFLDDPVVRFAALRAAALLRDVMMVDCGAQRCIADGPIADVGSSALALIAFAELVKTGADATFGRSALELAAFLRSQQRPDGELMHEYDRTAKRPIDVQRLYFTGEAALALSRAHLIGDDPRDLRAATLALSRLSGSGWSFFGSRYYFGEEHWTCQAMADLWSRAPDREALAFCRRWHGYQRRLQHVAGDSPFDDDGAFGVGPLLSPRVTPASSRGEAAGAALLVLRQSPSEAPADETAALDDELRRAIAFVLREQLRSPSHLFADPEAIRGAFPASPVDWQLRIDYAQHAGSMMIRWLTLPETHSRKPE